jgi:hypothetical protein
MMNRQIKFVAMLLIIISTQAASAQKHFIRTDVLGPFLNNPFSIAYERNWGGQGSFAIGLEGGWYMKDETSKFGQPFWEKRITGFGITPEWRHYIRFTSYMSRPVGVFTGLYGRVIQLDYRQTFASNVSGFQDVSEQALFIGGGPILGYKFKKPYSKFYFEVLGGAGWGAAKLNSYQADDFPDQYFLWRLEISLGYAFQ